MMQLSTCAGRRRALCMHAQAGACMAAAWQPRAHLIPFWQHCPQLLPHRPVHPASPALIPHKLLRHLQGEQAGGIEALRMHMHTHACTYTRTEVPHELLRHLSMWKASGRDSRDTEQERVHRRMRTGACTHIHMPGQTPAGQALPKCHDEGAARHRRSGCTVCSN